MARNLGDAGPESGSRPSAHYIDLRFSCRQTSQDHRPSDFEGNDSEDFIELRFPPPPEYYDTDEFVEKLHGAQSLSGAIDHHERSPGSSATAAAEPESLAGLRLLTADSKVMRSPRVSEQSLKVEVEDFYTALTVGIDSLERLAEPAFLTADFLQQSISLLLSIDSDVRILVEKLAHLRHPSSVEFHQVVAEYNGVSGKVLDVCRALKFTTILLKSYHNSQVEAAVAAVEGLVSVSVAVASRAIHVANAKQAGLCIDSCRAEMAEMQLQVKKLVESPSYGSLSYFVPNFNLTKAESQFAKWSGLWGVLFAAKSAASYICQLLLAAFAYAGQGPALVASSNVASFNSGWATSLMNLHIHARKQFNKMKDSSRSSCTFMSGDNDRLEYMLEDTKGHLQSLVDQGKFLNMGVYIGSWKADRKKLNHNVPMLRKHFLLVQRRLSDLSLGLESLGSGILEGQRYLAGLLLANSSQKSASQT